MLISREVYTVIIFIILGCAFLPFFYYYIKERKRKFWILLFLVILAPIDMYTPAVTTVTGCGEYKQQVLILPSEEYKLGNHSYISNESDQPLYLETIIYSEETNTDPDVDEDRLEFAIIPPGMTHVARSSSAPDYIFQEAPGTIQIKEGKVKLKYRLSCDPFYDEDWEIDEEFLFDEGEISIAPIESTDTIDEN